MGTGAVGALGGRTVRLLAVVVLAAVVVAVLPPAAGTAGPATDAGLVSVIVQAEPGASAAAARQVERFGGRVGRQLSIIGGFNAAVPASTVGRLAGSPGIVSVTEDERVAMQAAAYTPTTDAGSLYNTTLATGAQTYWKAGYTGKGVDVAVIDTGTAPVPGLATAGKIVNGPDLSFESQAPNLRYLDTYGHGTHMAGIIAGRGAGAVAGSYAGDTTNFLGMAPDARIVSVKVADAMGAADVSQVIAAIDWVVQNKNTGGLNIRVLNLSFGTNTSHPYTIDPLCHAVEAAWKKGITVVAATGNAGYYMTPGGAGLTSPARDPLGDQRRGHRQQEDRRHHRRRSGQLLLQRRGRHRRDQEPRPGRPGQVDHQPGRARQLHRPVLRGGWGGDRRLHARQRDQPGHRGGVGGGRADPSEAPHLDQQPGQGPAHHHRQAAHLRDPDPGGAGKGPAGPGQGLRGDQRGRRLQLHQQHRSRQPGGRPGDRAPGRQRGGPQRREGRLRRRRLDRHPGLQAHRRHGLDWRHLEWPHVVRLQLHRQQLDRHHLERPDVVGAHVVQRGLVRADVVWAHVVRRDLDRAHVVWRRLVRQHLVKRRLELTPPQQVGRRVTSPPYYHLPTLRGDRPPPPFAGLKRPRVGLAG